LSRRTFVALSAGTAALAALGAAGCAPGVEEAPEDTLTEVGADPEEGATWVTAACWHNCGGRCLNRALVKDGVVLRQGTDSTHEDSPDFPQQRACQRGRSQRMQVFGADRLKYPMRRKNWSPENPQGELRGEDEWVRMSWDEAYTLVADELKRIYELYGPESVFVLGGSELPRVFQHLGGYTPRWGQVSWGAWPDAYQMITGSGGYTSDAPDRLTMRKQKLIILWGANPASSSAGNPTYNYLQAKKAGARFVSIDPRYNESIEALGAQWIPIRPATDTAMALGMIHHIITSGLHDQEYLDTYTVGFDRDHMPTGDYPEYTYAPMERPDFTFAAAPVNPDENFKDYVLGEGAYASEGAKSPEWASELCGVPVETIKALAEEYATTRPASICSAGAPARINDGECFVHALLTLGMVCGQIGRDGGSVSATMHNSASNGGGALVSGGGAGVGSEVPPNPFPQKEYAMNNGEMWDAILEGSHTISKGVTREKNIQMIYQGMGAALNQRQAMTQGIKAHKKVEFVLCMNYVLNTSAKYADVVLPVTTEWERPGTLLTGNREILIYARPVTAPLYEAKSDQEITLGIAEKLGIDPVDVYDVDEEQQLFNKLAGSTFLDTDGEKKPLLTITAEDIERLGVSGEPQEGKMSLAEFEEKGIYQVERSEGDAYAFIPFGKFIEDPVANPVNTSSGKFEIHCQSLSNYIDWVGFSQKDPLPKYVHIIEGYEDSRSGDLPFQLINHHYQRRSHNVFDNVEWLREAWPQELWINAQDAAGLGIAEGDAVKLSSPYGSVARPAFVTQRIAPGAVSLGEGAWAQLTAEGVDEAGATNTLSAPIPTGQGHTGFNSNNCRIEKYGKPLMPDHEWPQRIVFDA
jgi:anaerobic dimethyl sulfoxide reductase subunit A